MTIGNMTSCSQMSCGHVHLELGEIKHELKSLKKMVDFAVKLLTKLVPTSIDDFHNILNGSTGLTITTVPQVVTSEADRLEIQAIGEPMETELVNAEMQDIESHDESPSVIVQIDSYPPSPKENELRSSSRASSCSVRREPTSLAPVAGAESTAKFKSNTKITSSTETNDVHSMLNCADLEISVQSVLPRNYSASPNSLPGSENAGIGLNFNDSNQCSVENNSNNSKTDTRRELEQTNYNNEQINLDNLSQSSSDPLADSILPEPYTEISSSRTETRIHATVVKEEFPSEYDDAEQQLQQSNDVKIEPEGEFITGMIPECVLFKNEDGDIFSNNKETASNNMRNDNYKYQIFSEYSTPASNNLSVYELGQDATRSQQVSNNQIPSPLKPLFGSALVSKLKQKIQEKIQAAVGTSNEENSIVESENDNLINTRSCINLSLAFNDDCENSKQLMVAESKLRPKFYQCKSCAKIFFCTITLHAHKNNCSGLRKQFRCNFCPLMFKSRAVLCNHRRLHAKTISKPRHKCDLCGREFILKSTLKKHRQSQICAETRMKCYKKLPQYFCIECGEGFLNDGNLALHQKLHAVDKNLTNSSVEDADVKKQNVPLVQTSKTARRYPCGYCDEAFIDRRSVTLHEKLHTDKEFAAFDQERRLIQRRHQLMLMMQKQQQKTSEKKFGCSVCGRCYPNELLLDMHTRLHHAIS